MTKKSGAIDYNVPLRLPIDGGDPEALFRRLIEFSYAVGRQYRADGGPAEEPGTEASRFVREELARPSEVEQAKIGEIVRPSPLLEQYGGYGAREAVRQNVSRPMPTSSEFVQHQLRGNEPQLPQMDREAYQRMKEYSVLPLELAAYEIPGAGQALAAVDLARGLGSVGKSLREGDKADIAGSATEAGLAASGARGRLAKAAAAVMAGLMPEEAEAGVIQKAMNAIRAYHGSPHTFDRFDMSKIGTGEGAQAYGHGLYFAENENIAKGYRDRLAKSDASMVRPDDEAVSKIKGQWDDIVARRQKIFEETGGRPTSEYFELSDMLDALNHQAIQDTVARKPYLTQGSMYEVDIHANPEHLLDWDRPLSEQPYVLQQLLSERKRYKNTVNDLISQRDAISAKAPIIQATGDDFADLFAGSDWRGWNDISKINQEIDAAKIAEKNAAAKGALYSEDFNKSALLSTPGRGLARSNNLNANDFLGVENDRELSNILRNAGIPGIKYLDAGSRGAGEGSRNYVIFDDSLIDILRRYAQGGEVEREDYDKGGSIIRAAMNALKSYKDPASKYIKDWNWRPLEDVQKDIGTSDVPEHVQNFGRYMGDISDKAATEGLDPEDVIKAYMITRSSIQREGRTPAKIASYGIPVREGAEGIVRPEGHMADFLSSPMGVKFLNEARKGDLSQDAVDAAVATMRPFGLSKVEPDAMDWARRNLPEQSANVSELVARAREGASSPDEWRAFTRGVRGVGPAKTGFLGSLLGRGDLPTLDARQAILHTGMKNAEAQDIMARNAGRAGHEAVDRLAARQRAMNFQMPEELDPFYQHLAHHTVWDAIGNEKTTHQDIIDAMKPRADGGEVEREDYAGGGSAIKNIINLAQKITSADTSIKQVPALLKSKHLEVMTPEHRNIDIGGGRFDLGTEYLRGRGVESHVLDPFNRPQEHNEEIIRRFSQDPAHSATIANVLNVIAEPEARRNVIQQARDLVAPGGKAYFGIYEGDRSGLGRATSKGWQENRPAASYEEEIAEMFPGLQRFGNIIIAPRREAGGEVSREDYDKGGGIAAAIKAAARALEESGRRIPLEEARRRVASPFSENPEDVQRALDYAKSLRVSQGEERIPGSFYNVKQTRPVSEVTSTVEELPGVRTKEINPMSWEDIVRRYKGATMFNVAGDRSNLGRLTHINERELAYPVDLHAGPKYMLEPNEQMVWANNPAHATGFQKAIQEAAKRGPVIGAYHPMGVQSVDSSHNMIDALLAQIARGDISKKDMRAVDNLLRQGAQAEKDKVELAIEAMRGWPGFENAREASEFARGLEGTRRAEIVKFLDKEKAAQGMAPYRVQGFPAVGETRVAITDPAMRGVSGNMLGHRIVEFNPDTLEPTGSLAFRHSTYTSPTAGQYVGDVPLVQTQYAMPNVEQDLMTKLAKGDRIVHPYSQDALGRSSWRKSLETRKLGQEVNQEMLDSIMLGLQRQKDYGLRRGGSVIDDALDVISELPQAAE
jgi:hypothetical protein